MKRTLLPCPISSFGQQIRGHTISHSYLDFIFSIKKKAYDFSLHVRFYLLVAIGIELAVVWEAICQAHVTGQCVTIQMLGILAALRELVKTNLSHYVFTEFGPQELKKNSLMQHHNEASNDSDLVKMDDHYSDEFFDFDDESECDYIITLPEDQTAKCTLLKTVSADWLKSDKREDHLAICPGNIVHKYAADGSPKFFIVINFRDIIVIWWYIRCCVCLRVRVSRGRNRCEAFRSKTPTGGAAFSRLLVLVPIVSCSNIFGVVYGILLRKACHEFCSGDPLSNNPFSTSQTLPSFTFCH
ncbi:unnamed protein product [Lactuca saligna]|uniref:Uncharacterized protein n=1 Tax=Lactuca saligna TaxID=75948 RepID=A0AA35UV24_LACSI|nr:unnamed protein product [Lactuca saligna]